MNKPNQADTYYEVTISRFDREKEPITYMVFTDQLESVMRSVLESVVKDGFMYDEVSIVKKRTG